MSPSAPPIAGPTRNPIPNAVSPPANCFMRFGSTGIMMPRLMTSISAVAKMNKTAALRGPPFGSAGVTSAFVTMSFIFRPATLPDFAGRAMSAVALSLTLVPDVARWRLGLTQLHVARLAPDRSERRDSDSGRHCHARKRKRVVLTVVLRNRRLQNRVRRGDQVTQLID